MPSITAILFMASTRMFALLSCGRVRGRRSAPVLPGELLGQDGSACPTTAGRSACSAVHLLASAAVIAADVAAQAGRRPQRRRDPGLQSDGHRRTRRTRSGRHGQADRRRQPPREPRRTEGSDHPHVRRRADRDHHSRGRRGRGQPASSGSSAAPASSSSASWPTRATTRRSIERAEAESQSQVGSTTPTGKPLAWWVPVKEGAGEAQFRLSATSPGAARKVRQARRSPRSSSSTDNYNVTGGYLTQAASGRTTREGQPVRELHLQRRGRTIVRRADRRQPARPGRTGLHLQAGHHSRRRALLGPLASRARSPTAARSPAPSPGRQVKDLVNVLNAGSLPAALDQGADQQAVQRRHARAATRSRRARTR